MNTMIESRTITIRPVNRSNFFSEKNKLPGYPKTTTTIGCELSKDGYKTGLSKEEQKEFEKLLGLTEGTLGRNSKWWGTEVTFTLHNDKSTIFEVNSTMDELKLKVLKNSSKVAPTQMDLEKMPEAIFVIYDEEAAAEKESKTIELKTDAYEALSEMTPEARKGLLKVIIFDNKSSRKGVDEMSDKLTKTYLAKELESNPKRFLEYTKDKELETKVILADAVERNIIRKERNYFSYGDDVLGNSTEDTIAFLMNPKNSSIRLSVETKLKNRKK